LSFLKKLKLLFGEKGQLDEAVPIHISENWEQYSLGTDVEKPTGMEGDLIQLPDGAFPEPDPNFEPDDSARPEALRICSDDYYLNKFGKTKDGMLVWIGSQLSHDHNVGKTTDYVFKFSFDCDGNLVSSDIRTVGLRTTTNHKVGIELMTEMIDSTSTLSPADAMIKVFTVVHEDVTFGLIPIAPESQDEEWCIQFMPGDTMAFYPPFNSGAYDT